MIRKNYPNTPEHEIKDQFELADTNMDKFIQWKEFKHFISGVKKVADSDHDGHISTQEV